MFLPCTPAHSYLSKDRPSPPPPTGDPSLPGGPRGWSGELRAPLPASPWERDFDSAMMRWWGLVLLRVSTLLSLCDCGCVY